MADAVHMALDADHGLPRKFGIGTGTQRRVKALIVLLEYGVIIVPRAPSLCRVPFARPSACSICWAAECDVNWRREADAVALFMDGESKRPCRHRTWAADDLPVLQPPIARDSKAMA